MGLIYAMFFSCGMSSRISHPPSSRINHPPSSHVNHPRHRTLIIPRHRALIIPRHRDTNRDLFNTLEDVFKRAGRAP